MDPFLGEIRMVGFNFAPTGWALCQGQTLSITQNTALFSLLGTYFGGNGTTNFLLPDLQSRSPVGVGQGAGLSPIQFAQEGGTENISMTLQNMPAHTHAATVSGGSGASGTVSIPATTNASTSHTPGASTVLGATSYEGHNVNAYSTAQPNTTLAPFNVSLQGNPPSITNALAGNSLPVQSRNPYLGINFIISLQGVYPSRS